MAALQLSWHCTVKSVLWVKHVWLVWQLYKLIWKQQSNLDTAFLARTHLELITLNILVTICTTRLTFNNSTFCPHCVFMCFVWISEQTGIICLYNINWLVLITVILRFKAQWLLYVPPV